MKKETSIYIPYAPFFEEKGVVATEITSVEARGFEYQNLPMGVQGEVDYDRPPKYIGRHIKRSDKRTLITLFRDDPCFRRSIEGLKDSGRLITPSELDEIMSIGDPENN